MGLFGERWPYTNTHDLNLDWIIKTCKEIEDKFPGLLEDIAKKLNAGKEQENIKFPSAYREEINRLFLKVLGCKEDNSILRIIHKNSMFGEIEE